MGIRDNNVGQRLHVTKTVGNPVFRMALAACGVPRLRKHKRPCRQLCPHIVGRADQAIFRQGSTEEGQLTQADRPCFSLNPSASTISFWRKRAAPGASGIGRANVLIKHLRRSPWRQSRFCVQQATLMWASCMDLDGSHPLSAVLKHSTGSIRRLRDRKFCHRGGALYMAVMSQWGTCALYLT